MSKNRHRCLERTATPTYHPKETLEGMCGPNNRGVGRALEIIQKEIREVRKKQDEILVKFNG